MLGRLALGWVGASFLAVSVWPSPRFVGAERCKLCHRDIYESWRRTPHASTATVDIDGDESCNSCHTTDVTSRRRGVQCEACHGAGGDYWPAEVMIDPDKASMAGLVLPGADVCLRCHEPAAPERSHPRELVMPETEWQTWVHIRDDR